MRRVVLVHEDDGSVHATDGDGRLPDEEVRSPQRP